ncbi:hypothetical protein DAI22_01g188800 [Oryza sativa Japonica Group]|nr:hypothetical protein DAI22_01g188800 [Oryza sativa Japonica Group]
MMVIYPNKDFMIYLTTGNRTEKFQGFISASVFYEVLENYATCEFSWSQTYVALLYSF